MKARVAVVTGAAGGIGAATAARFAAAGWQVVPIDREQVDLASAEATEALFAQTARRFPVVDALVNNAALQLAKPVLEITAAEWDEVLAVNLRAPFLAVRALHPCLRAAGRAAVVNVCSVHAVATSPGLSAYVASKGALLALTRALALELAVDGIRVNAVLPGAVDTPMLRAGLGRGGEDPAAAAERLATRTPVGRLGSPEEIAEAVYFLSDASLSGFVTGAALTADGGATARLSTE